ncbi:LETM1 domain containing protein [Trichuris trichiura]|uniref:LETM1 domain containing protein n=1 Tax=Trichuris trichiura TaxID=36087 RepID=A0A077YWR8_TRITR|nr:LETM1 domain containing protein [Trichuris trichiura]
MTTFSLVLCVVSRPSLSAAPLTRNHITSFSTLRCQHSRLVNLGWLGLWSPTHACNRFISQSSLLLDPRQGGKSKVEEMLKTLKEELEERDKLQKEYTQMQKSIEMQKKQSLWQKTVAECKHYYHGFKLLYFDLKVATRLIVRILKGDTLMRKERRQLVRTTSDIFRLVPFLIFIVVPFMEFTLPFFLKFFPGMLPSTFQEKSKEQEKLNQTLKLRLEMAKFLQATLEELSLHRKKVDSEVNPLADFSTFLKRIRLQEGYVSNEELLKYSKLFEDELTLDSLSHEQLKALCLIVGLKPMGTSNMLRFQLRLKLRELKADDRVCLSTVIVFAEGIDSLTFSELQTACRARGMRALGLPASRLRSQLAQWLALSLNEQVPPSLLLLSSTLYLPEEVPFSNRLKKIISTLPSHIADEAKLKLADIDGARVDNKAKYDLIVSIEEALRKEHEEEEKLREEQAKAAARAGETISAAKDAEAAIQATAIPVEKDTLLDSAPVLVDKAETLSKPIETEELREVEHLVETVQGTLNEAKEDLQELKEQVLEHKEDVEEVKAIVENRGESVQVSKAAGLLQNQVDRLIRRVDRLIKKVETTKDATIEVPSVTDASSSESNTVKGEKKLVTLNEVLAPLKNLSTVPDEAKMHRVIQVLKALDEDHDGAIDLKLALKVIDLMLQESVQVNSDQVNHAIEILKKEGLLEEEEELAEQTTQNDVKPGMLEVTRQKAPKEMRSVAQ